MPTYHLNIDGMTCGGCSGRVSRVLHAMEGVEAADIDHVQGRGVVQVGAGVSLQSIVATVEATGFACHPSQA